MESLKFLMVSTHYPPAHLGGDATFVEYLSNELVRAGHEVHVLHSPCAFAAQRGFMPGLDTTTDGGVHRHTHLPSVGRVDPVLGLVLGRGSGSFHRLRDLAGSLKPDVVHWHNTKGFIGRPVALPRSLSVYTAHDYYAICPRSSLLRPGQRLCQKPFLCQSCLLRWRKPPQLWRALWGRAMRLPDELTVISPSEYMAKRLSEDGVRVDHILRNFAPDRGQVRLGDSPRRVVYIGILERFKGLMTLLDAFNRSRDSQGFDLSVYGEGSLRAALENRVKSSGIEGRARIHGHVPLDEIKGALGDAAAIIVPSESYENAPLAALEALSMGIPVIGSRIGGLPEILGPDSGSVLVPPGDSASLARELVALWDSRGDLLNRSRKARTAYESSYSPKAHIAGYMRILKGCK